MGAGIGELAGHLDVIVEVVLGPRRVVDVARITDHGFEHFAALEHGVHGDPHVVDPVETVEGAKHVNTGTRRLVDEGVDHVIGIVGVADAVRGPEQHLEEHVGDALAQHFQAMPGAFVEEAHGDVESGAAPALEAEQLRQVGGVGIGHLDHVEGAHAGRQ